MTGCDLQLVVPAGIEDPSRPSGGNTYDRRLRGELAAAGWVVSTRSVPGSWPWPDDAARRSLAAVVSSVPDGSLVLLDGLLASTAPEVVVPAAARLRLAVLLHLPAGWQDPRADVRLGECAVLGSAAAVVTTSEWTRDWALATYRLDPRRVHAAPPGVDLADPAGGTAGGGSLLCVAAVTPAKGHDLLLAALERVADLPWRCRCVGPLLDDAFAAQLRKEACRAGLEDRFVLTGPLDGRALAARYAAADLLVLPSRAETYGMVVTEALSRAVPVLASEVGGVPEALGAESGGPGVLLPPDDVSAWAGALRDWLDDPSLRQDLRGGALARRDRLSPWRETARRVARVLAEVPA